MDGTQTSEPTETGPGSPGLASAFRRALDDQAQTEGPLDLTVPLNIAEIRAALSNSGPIPVVPASAAAPPRGVAPPRPHDGRRSRHAHSRRLGRIAVFVTLAAALSVGTATALVLSSSSQGSSVSLPPTSGNIPGLPTGNSTGIGQTTGTSGSTTAQAAASPSHSAATTTAAATSAAPSTTADASGSASGDPSSTAGSSASADPSSSAVGGVPSSSGSTWVTLYWGIQNEEQEVSQVQSMLDQLGYLWHHHAAYVNPMYNGVQPDSIGTYGSATEDAIASFQQDFSVAYGGQAGTCDYPTYEALIQAVNAQSGQVAQTAQAGQST